MAQGPRVVSDQPRRGVQRRWFVIGGVLLVVLVSLGSLVRFYTDLLWFRAVGFASVFWTVLWSRAGIGVVGGIIAGVFVLANLELARRAAPRYRFVTRAGDVTEQYRSLFRPYAKWVNAGVSALVGFLTGLSVSTAWDTFLLWRYARPFGVQAPEPFGQDVSFYVFSIPFQRVVLSFLFSIVIASVFLAAAAHLLNGAIAPEPGRLRIAAVVKVHVSVLLGILALLKAWAYRLDQFELVFSPRGTVVGASYTDVNAQLPALRLLMIIAVVAALIFFVNIRFRGWMLPGAAIALWAFSSVLLGAIIPAAVQRFQVEPAESEREEPYIELNIAATRDAFDLERIDVREFAAETTLDEADIAANQGTIDNVRLWNPSTLIPSYQRLQAIRTYYNFTNVDVDRYFMDGQMRQFMISAREVFPENLQGEAQNWVNTRLTYTHGYGIVATPANAVTPGGHPELAVRDLPPEGPPELTPEQGAIYYGENVPTYSIVRTDKAEIDFPVEDQVRTTTYDGTGGVQLTNVLRRLAFAWRFGDANLLISNFITPESRVLLRRDIQERAATVAPFLRFDRDPYMVVAEGRLFWILDAYTETDRYPYADTVRLQEIFGPDHVGTINYMRNSVKVVVDAYNGTMDLYVVDPSDPLIGTYQRVFPDLFTPGDQIPDDVRRHLRYPEDLFLVQAAQYRLYHVTNPQRLYEREDVWDIPTDPTRVGAQPRTHMEPYYLVMKLPGEEREEFLLMLPFTPADRPILNGWLAARSDPEHYGELVAFSFPRGQDIPGPQNVSARIEQDETISQQFTLWEGAGSSVERGSMFVIPIADSLMYVQPIYLRASEETALPELRRVVVVLGDNIGFENTFDASLEAALVGRGPSLEGEEPPPEQPGEEPPADEPPAAGDVAQLLQRALDHFARADAALREGDLATYQNEIRAGRAAVEEARRRSGEQAA